MVKRRHMQRRLAVIVFRIDIRPPAAIKRFVRSA